MDECMFNVMFKIRMYKVISSVRSEMFCIYYTSLLTELSLSDSDCLEVWRAEVIHDETHA